MHLLSGCVGLCQEIQRLEQLCHGYGWYQADLGRLRWCSHYNKTPSRSLNVRLLCWAASQVTAGAGTIQHHSLEPQLGSARAKVPLQGKISTAKGNAAECQQQSVQAGPHTKAMKLLLMWQ